MRTLEQSKQLAARRLREHLQGNMPILQSQAFDRFAQGLRVEDFEELVVDLIAQNTVARDLSKRGAFVLRRSLDLNQQAR